MIVVVVGPAGAEDPANLAEWFTRFPDLKAARIVENVIYLMGLILAVPLFLALYRTLRKTSLASALFGSALGIIGLIEMMVSSTSHIAHSKLFDLYAASGVTPADQETLGLMWQTVWGLDDMVLYVGFFIVPLGLIVLGVGMFGTPSIGKRFGWASVVLGVIGFITAVLQIIDPASGIGAIPYFTIIIFCFVMGWKVYTISRTM